MASIVLFGSSHFSLPVLHKLVEKLPAANCQLVAVVTTPPRPSGRGLRLTPNIVQTEAESYGIPVFTDIKDLISNWQLKIGNSSPIGLVAAYGRIIGPKTLDLFNHQIYGLHPSLLPKYRGPSPLQQQILDGINETGITLYQLDQGEDTGPIVAQEPDTIHTDDTQITLGNRLFLKGTNLFLNSQLAISNLQFAQQDASLASNTKKITRQDGFIPWEEFNHSLAISNWPLAIEKKLRAFFPWPGVWSINPQGKRVKLISLKPKVVVQEEGK